MTSVIQASFNSGEWSPKLFARVDMQKYRSGAALLENFFVDYRGGASTRPGTKYILQCFNSNENVRLIPFQASFAVGYVLEFGHGYIRFYFNSTPVLEPAFPITGVTQANPATLSVSGFPPWGVGNWIFVEGVGGMTQLNDRYFNMNTFDSINMALGRIIDDANINSTGYSAYTTGGTAARVYTINSPYTSDQLHDIKFAQNVNQMILCHPEHPPYVLTLVAANNWTLLPIVFGSSAAVPAAPTITTTLAAGTVFYSYVVTSVDGSGQESNQSSPGSLSSIQDLRTVAGSNKIAWSAAAGAVAYNVYKADVSYFGVVAVGTIYGYIGSTEATEFVDSNIAADFSQTPPIAKNPFLGQGIASVTVTASGTYTTVPTVTFTGSPFTIVASAAAVLQVHGTPTVGAGGTGYAINDTVTFADNVTLVVATVGGGGAVATFYNIAVPGSNPGQIHFGSTPSNPVPQISTSGSGTGATTNLVWGVGLVEILNPGTGYTTVPTVVFSSGAATAFAIVSATATGNPTVPSFFQQRLILAAPLANPQTFYMSRPGSFFNFDVSSITQPDDSITGTLVSGQLNTIRSMVSQTSGLLMFTDRNSWIINGGNGQGSPISPTALVANAQSFNGISNVPPIIANFDVLYVQAKGSIVRDSAYNIYANVFTGTDISAIASHLFYGHTVDEWAWAEEPFKVVWAIRDDGVMLTLTFLKEQEFIGWAHSTTAGNFKSVCTVVENTDLAGEVDAVYTVVERLIDGHFLKYIERISERVFTTGVADAWCVDCGIGYVGAPATNFSGAEFLAGRTVTGLADGVIVPPFVMNTAGTFTLATPASKVTVGIAYNCDLQTLPLEIGDPTVQGKVKKINSVDVRVAETLGLSIGSDFNSLTPMKDLIRGNVSTMLVGQASQIVTDLVDGDAGTFLDPTYTIPGQYCIQQSNPYPATILGVIPSFDIGDNGARPR